MRAGGVKGGNVSKRKKRMESKKKHQNVTGLQREARIQSKMKKDTNNLGSEPLETKGNGTKEKKGRGLRFRVRAPPYTIRSPA